MNNLIDIEYYLDHFNLNDETIKVYDVLLKKFELNKKIYSRYELNYKVNSSFKELTTIQYQKLITCLLLLSVLIKDVRYYNTALKIGDKINFVIPVLNVLDLYGKK